MTKIKKGETKRMESEILEYLEETYQAKIFDIELINNDEYETTYNIKIKDLSFKYTYSKNYTFDYNMLYLKSQVNKMIIRFKIEGVELK